MITLEQQPYLHSARGQKLIYRASSTELAEPGFKYIVRVLDVFKNRNYDFLYDPTPFDEKLYFDLNPLVNLRNWENESGKSIVPHYTPFDQFTEEPEGYGYSRYDVQIGEGWLINGIFTENPYEQYQPVDADQIYVYNAYLQPFYGFRPDPDGLNNLATTYSLQDNQTYCWSDRYENVHKWDIFDISQYVSPDNIFIPAYDSDWGAIALAGYNVGPLENNLIRKCQITLHYNNITAFVQYTKDFIYSNDDFYPFIHVGIYPQNLKLAGNPIPDPTSYDWDFYKIVFLDGPNDPVSRSYVIYNAAKYGQHDCKNDIIRIAWVSMRGGWDYFNFIKRSEITNQVDRKQFTRRLNNSSSGIFYPNQRQTIDLLNLNERILTVTSDWIQENEFIYLKNLFNSNQVHWLTKPTVYPVYSNNNQNPEQAVPVSLVDTSFIEQRGRNGKLVNVTLKFKITQNYWT